MEQNELSEGRLLDKEGNLNEAGFAYSLIKTYHRDDIRARGSRIKEWDYYYIGNRNYGIALTIDDNSYMDLCSVTFLDYRRKKYDEKSSMHPFSYGKLHLPETSRKGDTVFEDRKVTLRFANSGKERHLYGRMKDFKDGKDFTIDCFLEETCYDSMVIATPFTKPKHFYYNQKINNLKARGHFTIGEIKYSLDDCFGVLDWGRGVWTRENTWYWGSLSTLQDRHMIGFNLGYGFGDTSKATENMFFYDNKAYKLDDVTFHIPQENNRDVYEMPWSMTSAKGDIHLTFTPLIVRKGGGSFLFIKSIQRQVFGYYDGTILINSKPYEINHQLGFAEKVYNKW